MSGLDPVSRRSRPEAYIHSEFTRGPLAGRSSSPTSQSSRTSTRPHSRSSHIERYETYVEKECKNCIRLHDQVFALQRTIESLRDTQRDQVERLERLFRDSSSTKAVITHTHGCCYTCENAVKVHELRSLVDVLKSELVQVNHVNVDLTGKNTLLLQEWRQSTEENQTLRRDLEATRSSVESGRAEVARLTSRCDIVESRDKATAQSLLETQLELSRMRERCEDALRSRDETVTRLTTARVEIDTHKATEATLRARILQLEKDLKVATEDLAEVRTEVARAKGHLLEEKSKNQTDRMASVDEVSRLRIDLERVTRERNELRCHLDVVQRESTERRDRVFTLDKDLETLQRENRTLRDFSTELSAEVEALRQAQKLMVLQRKDDDERLRESVSEWLNVRRNVFLQSMKVRAEAAHTA